LRYHAEDFSGVHRNAFVAALNAEGIHSDGRFYEAVYLSSLFQFPERDYPSFDRLGKSARCPVAERAGYEESVWLPHQILLGSQKDVDDVLTAIDKVRSNVGELVAYDDEAIRIQGLSRAERALLESKPPY
jgi:dTDP-4-amino-4,6-dideoxygalactose transaminase